MQYENCNRLTSRNVLGLRLLRFQTSHSHSYDWFIGCIAGTYSIAG